MSQSIGFILKICFHLSPLAPFFYSRWSFAAALLLTVLLCYIKTIKINHAIEDLVKNNRDPETIQSLRKTRNFWKAFTFLPESFGKV